jgi:endonuclease YncB( thermonuclease family)
MSVSARPVILASMRRGLRLSLVVLTSALFAIAAAGAAPDDAFTLRGTVAHVVDGDTLEVVLAGGKRERVRLVGVEAAERGACFAAQAAAHVRRLAQSQRVVLKGDGIQPTRDRYDRLLAYVWLPGGRDLGYQLIAAGSARVYDASFDRLGAYRRAESGARGARTGLWKTCAQPKPVAPAAPPSGDCHPSYSPCLPVAEDLDCADVRALGKAPVRVLGSDPYRLDGDRDGFGCE